MIKMTGVVKEIKRRPYTRKDGSKNEDITVLVDIGRAYPEKLKWRIDRTVPKKDDKIDLSVLAFARYWNNDIRKFVSTDVNFYPEPEEVK